MFEKRDPDLHQAGRTDVHIVLPLSGVVILPGTRTKLQVDPKIGKIL
jgi:hypothetical protein